MGIQLDQSFDEQLRSEIHMDLLLDSYLHAAKKGFSWQDVCRAVRLMEDMLTMIRGKVTSPMLVPIQSSTHGDLSL